MERHKEYEPPELLDCTTCKVLMTRFNSEVEWKMESSKKVLRSVDRTSRVCPIIYFSLVHSVCGTTLKKRLSTIITFEVALDDSEGKK